ncbi:MAG TPA: helix-turn-helix domain-containing protein [Solirubrobacterales bacterium]|nr:helix-turn-helix domain-containing protein [Solirubrobacterales bacterium]
MQYLSQRLAVDLPEARAEERPRGPVASSQRERLLAATEALIAEKGAAATTIEAIVKGAGVSSATFYEHFKDKEGCFVAAFEKAVDELEGEVRGAVPAEAVRDDQVRAGLAALLATIDAEPARARLCFVEAQKGGRRMQARYDAALDAAAAELADPLGRGIAGGLAWLLRERLELGGGGSVQDLLPRMTEVILGPNPADG